MKFAMGCFLVACLLGVVAGIARVMGEPCLDRGPPPWFGSRSEVLDRVRAQGGEMYSFAVLGDIQQGHDAFRHALREVSGDPSVRFAILCGDLVNNGSEPHYRLLFETAGREGSRVPFLAVPGNHDDPANYRRLVGPASWSVRVGPDLLVGLDNARGVPEAEDVRRLDRLLGETPVRHRFVFLHRPLLKRGQIRPGYSEMLEVFERHGVDAVFAGHTHEYEVKTVRGVLHCSNGMGGDLSHDTDGEALLTIVRVDGDGLATQRVSLGTHAEIEPILRDMLVAHLYAPLRGTPFWTMGVVLLLGLALFWGHRALGETAWLPAVALFAPALSPPPDGLLLAGGFAGLAATALLAVLLAHRARTFRRLAGGAVLVIARSPWLAGAALIAALALRRLPHRQGVVPHPAASVVFAFAIVAVWIGAAVAHVASTWALLLLAALLFRSQVRVRPAAPGKPAG